MLRQLAADMGTTHLRTRRQAELANRALQSILLVRVHTFIGQNTDITLFFSLLFFLLILLQKFEERRIIKAIDREWPQAENVTQGRRSEGRLWNRYKLVVRA